MKKLVFLACCLPVFASAQKLIGGNNIVRWNIGSMVLNNYHFTYEHSITKHFSLSLSYRTMPKGDIPFKSQLKDAIKSNSIDFDKAQMGNTAWTVAGRLYLGLGRMKGFYLEPYLRFASFDVSAPITYTYTSTTPPTAGQTFTKSANFNGKITSTSPGLLLGWQFQLATKLVMDIQLIGGHYGHSSGDLNFVATLSDDEKNALQKEIDNIKSDPFKLKGTVTNSGARISSDGPWAGIRGANIGIGFRF